MKKNKQDQYEKKVDKCGYPFWIIPKYPWMQFFHKCYILRVTENPLSPNGHFCGYMEIEPGTHFDRKHYADITAERDLLYVHGGLTYSNVHESFDETKTKWYLGFDCNHLFDQDEPKDFEYVLNQLRYLSYCAAYYDYYLKGDGEITEREKIYYE